MWTGEVLVRGGRGAGRGAGADGKQERGAGGDTRFNHFCRD